jgi:hypothetical protein
MERLLNEMIRRSAVFDVVFWEGELLSYYSKAYHGLSLIGFQILATSR